MARQRVCIILEQVFQNLNTIFFHIFWAISILDKLIGVIPIFIATLILLVLPFTDRSVVICRIHLI